MIVVRRMLEYNNGNIGNDRLIHDRIYHDNIIMVMLEYNNGNARIIVQW